MCWLWADKIYSDTLKLKTRMCRFKRDCPYGISCQYAHTKQELRAPADNEWKAYRNKF
jgi:hypothetical protein